MSYKFESTLRVLASGDPRVFEETIYRQFGLKIIGVKNFDPLEKRVQAESISSMASMITEDVDEFAEVHPARMAAKRIAEENGYIVRVLREMGVGTGDIGMAPAAPAPVKPGTRPGPGEKRSPGREKKRKKSSPFNPPRPAKVPKPKACSGRM